MPSLTQGQVAQRRFYVVELRVKITNGNHRGYILSLRRPERTFSRDFVTNKTISLWVNEWRKM